LDLFSQDTGLGQCEALQKSMTSLEAALLLVRELTDSLCTALRQEPLAQIPFRHQYQDGLGVLRLASGKNVSLSLVIYEQRDQLTPQTVCFSDCDTYEIVLAGAAEGRMFRLDPKQKLNQMHLKIESGDTINLCGANEAKLIEQATGRMVVLRLTKSPAKPSDSREYRLSDGTLIHRASGSRKDSRLEIAMALLGAMERDDAAKQLSQLAAETDHVLRWQALRQCLALDTEKGFGRLSAISREPRDPLSEQAQALRLQLLDKYPQLAMLEGELCHA
jgi:hypothetical protein